MSEQHFWSEDELVPRVDTLVADFTDHALVLPVEHPQWFMDGDLVRVGDDDLYDTGLVDEVFGTPIMRVRNEAVRILDASTMECRRGEGVNPPRPVRRGQRVTILGNKP